MRREAQEREAFSHEAREEGGGSVGSSRAANARLTSPGNSLRSSNEANRRMIDMTRTRSRPPVRHGPGARHQHSGVYEDGLRVDRDASHSKADVVRRKGFVVYLPVYQEDEPAGTVAERRRALRGFVVGTFRSDEPLR